MHQALNLLELLLPEGFVIQGNKTKADSATLTTLATYGHVGQSTATNPTFAWYIPDRQSYPVESWLYESDPASYGGKGEQVYQTRLSSSAGKVSSL